MNSQGHMGERGIAAGNVKPAAVHMRASKDGVVVRLDRTPQYSETFVIEPRGCGVLDAPLSRGMTAEGEERTEPHPSPSS